MALPDGALCRQVLDQVFPDVVFPDYASISEALLSSVMGMGFPVNELSADFVMIPKKMILECSGFDAAPLAESLRMFGRKLLDRKRELYQAVDVCTFPLSPGM